MKKNNRMSPELIDKLPHIAEMTENFSGAEIEGLVKAASSYALTRCVDVKDLSKASDVSHLILEYEDSERALMDIEPKFGAKDQELKAYEYYRNGFVPYGDSFDYLMGTMERLVEQGKDAPAYGLHLLHCTPTLLHYRPLFSPNAFSYSFSVRRRS